MNFKERMGNNSLDSILNAGRPGDDPDCKFFQLMRVDSAEHFLEFRFNEGIRIMLSYDKLTWVNYSPQQLDFDFMGTRAIVVGRGLLDLFLALKSKKVSWIKEADIDLLDNESNTVFISSIRIFPPDDDEPEEE